MSAVTREDAISFLETACRNWSKVPKLSEEDIGDVSMALLQFVSLRSKPVAGVEVKPLEWRKDRDWRYEAMCLLGKYTAFQPRKGGHWFLSLGQEKLGNSATDGEAKAAAEADYRQRILSSLSLPAQEPAAYGVYLAGGRFMDIASDNRDDAVAMAEALHDPHEFMVKPLYLSPSVCEGKVTEAMRAEALRQLQLRDERDQRVHDIIEDLREIVLAMPTASRPEGLMKKAQDAVYGMRGRTRLMDDAALKEA